jgi:mono/diheme cytochrome c family protein
VVKIHADISGSFTQYILALSGDLGMRILLLAVACVLSIAAGVWLAACSGKEAGGGEVISIEKSQVPTWSEGDMQTFLHGSMSTEFAPELVVRAFMRTYPDLFPTKDFSHLGAIADPKFGWPVGFSKARREHLANLSAVGINCASCHVSEIAPAAGGGRPVRVLGVAAHFNAEAFFGSIFGATFLTMDPANMQKFLAAYLEESDPAPDAAERVQQFKAAWDREAADVTAAMKADPAGAKGAGPGGLHAIAPEAVHFDSRRLKENPRLAELSVAMLKLFHNMRAALHVPDQPPAGPLPSAGPGRNDAFGTLSATLFGSPQPFAPVKYGMLWNVEDRPWVHWDGNTRSPIARNVLAAVGLGAPMIGNRAMFDFKMIVHQTELSEKIRAPKYPFAIDRAAAKRGAKLYEANCASCHTGEESDRRLYPAEMVGTDPLRAKLFTPEQAGLFNKFLATLESPGYVPPKTPGIRSTGKYWAAGMEGVWARSPYLHNGSVRTMAELLTPAGARPVTWKRGSRVYDPAVMGFTDDGAYVFDTGMPGNSNKGHEYGTKLSAEEKRDLMEFLKTR